MAHQSEKLKRIIMILGGKGGTGKTLHCRQTYYFLVRSGVSCLAFDADHENPEFCEYHANSPHPVLPLNFLDKSEAKHLFTQLDQQSPEVVLLDMPGASGELTRQQIETFGLFTIAQELGYRVTIDTVLNNAYNSITSLQSMLDFCGDRADYVVVKSLFWETEGMTFSRWENSKTRADFEQLGGIEIEMPIFELTTFDVMQEEALSFFEKDKLPYGDRILANSFLNRSLPQLQRAAHYLGLATSPGTTNTANSKAKSSRASTKKSPAAEPVGATCEPSQPS